MTRLASRFGAANLIRRDRPLTREELFRVVPSVFSEDTGIAQALLSTRQQGGARCPLLPLSPLLSSSSF